MRNSLYLSGTDVVSPNETASPPPNVLRQVPSNHRLCVLRIILRDGRHIRCNSNDMTTARNIAIGVYQPFYAARVSFGVLLLISTLFYHNRFFRQILD